MTHSSSPNPFTPKRIFSPLELTRTLATLPTWHALRTHALAQSSWTTSRAYGESVSFLGPVPWWPYSATEFIDQVFSCEARVLEIGGGASTLWWLDRGNSVTCLEPDQKWANYLITSTKDSANRLELLTRSVSENIQDLTAQRRRFDIIIIDCAGDRLKILSSVNVLRASDGFIALDNYDRFDPNAVAASLRDQELKPVVFSGISPINAYDHHFVLFSPSNRFALEGQSRPLFRHLSDPVTPRLRVLSTIATKVRGMGQASC